MKRLWIVLLVVIIFASPAGAAPLRFPQGGTGSDTAPARGSVATSDGDKYFGDKATVSVKAFGAVGDGLADDYAAILAAINSDAGGLTVIFPPGLYRIGTPIPFKSNRRYLGAGIGVTTVKLKDSMGIGACAFVSAAPLTNVEIAYMTVDGNAATNQGDFRVALLGIGAGGQTEPVTNIRFHYLEIKDSTEYGIGIEGGTPSNLFFDHITITDTDRDGIDFKNGAGGPYFLNNIAITNWGRDTSFGGEQAALDLRGESHLTNIVLHGLSGNNNGIRFNRGTVGLTPDQSLSSARSTLTGFAIYSVSAVSSTTHGIRLRSHDISISNGYIQGANYGVYIEGPVDPAVIGNSFTNVTVDGSLTNGFYSSGAGDSRLSFVNCQAINGLNGFVIAGDYVRLIGNTIENNSGKGITFTTAATHPILALNHVRANGQNLFNNLTTTLHAYQNYGIATETSGVTVLGPTETSQVVTHGLVATPDLQGISVTPTNNPTNAVKYWFDTPTATTFTLHLSGVPGASSAYFVWRAKVLE